MEYTVSDVRECQLEELEQLERECFSRPWTLQQLRAYLRSQGHEFIAAVSESGETLGYVGMMYVLDEGYISNVAVRETYRRMGIGGALIGELLRRAAALRLTFVTLEVRAGNAPAIALYEKLGFLPVGRRKGYYEQPREDALLLTKFLNRGAESENTGV